jgi:hypothetical protein
MFKHVFIVQCQSTGEFLTPRLNYTHNLNLAGRFPEKESALNTALNDLDFDFVIYDFYERENGTHV